MKRHLSPLLFFCLALSQPAGAQNLRLPDLLKLSKANIPYIDTFLTNRSFEKADTDSNADYSLHKYRFLGKDNDIPRMRVVMLSYRMQIHVRELEYGLWQKADADEFIGQLLKAGYKKQVTSLPIIGSSDTMKSISYRKGNVAVGYNEVPIKDTDQLLYKFTFVVEHYSPGS